MKAIITTQDHECVLDTIPIPKLSDGQVLIKTICTPIHMLDIGRMRGSLGSFTGVPGFEGAGIVIKTGGGFKTQKLKDKKVCFFKHSASNGSWSEYVLCDFADCCVISEEFGFIKAATLMLIPLTLIMIGNIIKKKKFHCIISTLAGSALGKMLQRWCNYKDIVCINVVRSEERARELVALGAKYVVTSSSEHFIQEFYLLSERLKPMCCFDGLGGKIGKLALSFLQPKGVMYVYGTVAENPGLDMTGDDLVVSQKKIKGLWMPDWYSSLPERKKQSYFKKIQKRQHIFRTDSVIVMPVIDVLPFLNDYFNEYPKNKLIMDFSELSHTTQLLCSPLPSPKVSFSSTSHDMLDDFEESIKDLSETASSYLTPESSRLMSELPILESLKESSTYIEFEDSSIYLGPIVNKKPEGFCYIYHQTGDVYQGFFEFGHKKGKGRMLYNNGDWFEGSWKEDIPAGSGVYHFADGRTIQGNFLQTEVIGTGIELAKNGTKYEGSFLNKKRHGKGTLTSKEWKFDGKFRAGDMFGYGIVKYNDGKEFAGEFTGNIGVGLLKYADLTYYEGKIVDFKEDGEGELVNAEGIRKRGIWEQGKLKCWVEDYEVTEKIEEKNEKSENEYMGTPVELVSSDDIISVMVIR